MVAPSYSQSIDLSNVTFEFSELRMHDGSSDFVLTAFDADAADADYGSISFVAPHIHLAATVSAPLVGDEVTFPAGSLRMDVSSVIVSQGEVLFDGARSSETYVNTGSARAMRTQAGGFAFVDAPFEAGGYVFVLNTEGGTRMAR